MAFYNVIKGTTAYYGIIGNPVKHSASPILHNAAFAKMKLDNIYHAIHADYNNLENVIKALKVLGYRGFNVTVPFKEKILKYLDFIYPSAAELGAVNTVINKNGKLLGYNTDGDGFVLFMDEEKLDITNKKITLLGAGGSAKSIAYSLANKKVESINVINRSIDNANIIQSLLKKCNPELQCNVMTFSNKNCNETISSSDIIIQTTPIGMTPKAENSILETDIFFNKNQILIDIIYSPKNTKIMKLAAKKGCKVFNGIGMLAGQGVLGFEKFTGQKVPYLFYNQLLTKNL